MAKDLTERQRGVLNAIQAWIKEQGYPPTIRELGKQLGIKSLRGVTTHLDAIARKGHIDRRRHARGIRVLVEQGATAVEHTLRVPIVGRIAAGTPLFAAEHLDGQLVIDASLIGQERADSAAVHFALRVKGDSMQGAGILDGDYVIVRQQPDADNGDVVAALLGEDATVKRFYKEGDRVRLQPEHPTMEPLLVSSEQGVLILGKVVAVFRQLT